LVLINSIHGCLGFCYRARQLRLWREEILAGGPLQGLAARWPDRKMVSLLVPALTKHGLSAFRRDSRFETEDAPASIAVTPGAMMGVIERVPLDGGRAAYRGWAAGLDGEPARELVFLRGKTPISRSRPYMPKLGLALR